VSNLIFKLTMKNNASNNSIGCRIKSNALFLFNLVLAALVVFLIKNDSDLKNQEKKNQNAIAQNSQEEILLNNQRAVSQDRESLLRGLNTDTKGQKQIETITTTTTTTTPPPAPAPKSDSKTKTS
jgi:hypothetical protein